MKIQYCGGWGYKKHALAIQREVEKMHPQIFEYVLLKDSGVTGNLEVTINNKEGASGGETQTGEQVHSKRNGQGYAHSDWENFHVRLESAMKNIKWVATDEQQAYPHETVNK